MRSLVFTQEEEVTNMSKRLDYFNERVRGWANRQPLKYRKSAMAFGYRCNVESRSFTGTLQWISDKTRGRDGEYICRRKLAKDLRVFQDQGVIEVKRHRRWDDKTGHYINGGSTYTVHLDRAIDVGKIIPADDDPWGEDSEMY